MDILNSIGGKVLEQITQSLMTLAGDQIGFVVYFEENIRILEDELHKLGDVRRRVEGRVDRARKNGEIIEDDIWKWLTRVHGLKEEVEEFLEGEVRETNQWCLRGWCPNVWLRYQLGKEAKKNKDCVVELNKDGIFDTVAHPAPPPEFESASSTDYEEFESRKLVFLEIMEALKDDEIKMIGVYGMGGVGKTRMVEEVGKQAKKDMLFEEVVMAVVSQNINVKKIQTELAARLGLNLDSESEFVRADRLHNRLKDEKKILVIIDDVWDEINLKQIGIPIGDGVGCCKIIFTSRSRGVCIQMNVQKDFAIGVLSEDEAWTLFKKKVGNCTGNCTYSPEIRSVAVEVCRECGGLPVAILAVGAALKNYKNNKHVWDDALEQLRNSRLNNIGGLETAVYSRLELSYNYLEPADAKSFFLLCCLFPEDAEISVNKLMAYGMGMRLLRDVDTKEKARNRVQMLVDNLKTSCLLLGGVKIGHVKMHDVSRDVAISITSKNKQEYLVRTGVEEWPEMDTYECYIGISLWSTTIRELPNDLICPNPSAY